jgi:hypothetical protein
MRDAKPPHNLVCLECGKGFTVQNHRKNVAKYCSQDCGHKGRINHDNPVNYAIRRRQVYMDWRRSILERDNYQCQICGIRNGVGLGKTVYLNVDHIEPLIDIVNKYNLKTVEDMINCDVMWSMENGRTLCVECHKKTDTYGVNAWRGTNRCVGSV